MTSTHLNNLIFLLAGSSLSLACDININGDSGDDTGSSAGTSNGDGMTSDVDDGMTSDVDDGMTSDVDDGMTSDVDDGTDAMTTVDDGMTSDVDDGTMDGMTTGAGGRACGLYADTLFSCMLVEYTYDEIVIGCESFVETYVAMGDKGCDVAAEEFFVCLSTLDCKELAQGTGCEDETAAFVDVCNAMPPMPE